MLKGIASENLDHFDDDRSQFRIVDDGKSKCWPYREPPQVQTRSARDWATQTRRREALRLIVHPAGTPGATGVERLRPQENDQRSGGGEWGGTDWIFRRNRLVRCIIRIEGPLGQIGPIRSFAIRRSVSCSCGGNITPARKFRILAHTNPTAPARALRHSSRWRVGFRMSFFGARVIGVITEQRFLYH